MLPTLSSHIQIFINLDSKGTRSRYHFGPLSRRIYDGCLHDPTICCGWRNTLVSLTWRMYWWQRMLHHTTGKKNQHENTPRLYQRTGYRNNGILGKIKRWLKIINDSSRERSNNQRIWKPAVLTAPEKVHFIGSVWCVSLALQQKAKGQTWPRDNAASLLLQTFSTEPRSAGEPQQDSFPHLFPKRSLHLYSTFWF